MLKRHLFTCVLFASCTLAAGKKEIKPAQSGNELVDVTAQALVDRPAVSASLGMDPGMDLIVVDVKVAPKGDTKIAVSRDDFTLISRKDGQRSQPLAPSQIAGKGVMVVTSTGPRTRSGMMGGNRGPIWGGVPGAGDRPRRVGGDSDIITAGDSGPQAEARTAANEGSAENPLLAVLKARILPEKETNDAVSGDLFFLFEGKHKLKDFDLIYKTASGNLILEFGK